MTNLYVFHLLFAHTQVAGDDFGQLPAACPLWRDDVDGAGLVFGSCTAACQPFHDVQDAHTVADEQNVACRFVGELAGDVGTAGTASFLVLFGVARP